MEDFGAVLGNTSEQIEDKDQYMKFREKLKQYILRVLQNPLDIIVLVRYLKDPIIVLNKPIHIAMSAEDKKDPIIVMIQTEEIKKFVKKMSTLQKNIIKLYGLI